MGCNCDKHKGGNFSIVEAAKSISRAVSSAVKTVSNGNYNPLVSEETKRKRLDICTNCEMHTYFLNKLRCTVCGCFLQAKTSLKDQVCPHPDGPKWQQEP